MKLIYIKAIVVVLSVILILAFVWRVARNTTTPTKAEQKKVELKMRGDEIANSIYYIKDSRTEICYGVLGSWAYGGAEVDSITAIPCEQVQHLLVN